MGRSTPKNPYSNRNENLQHLLFACPLAVPGTCSRAFSGGEECIEGHCLSHHRHSSKGFKLF